MAAKQNRLKVGLVLDDSLDSTDGVQQYVCRIAEWLGAQGHDVHFLVGQTKRTDLPNLHQLSRNLRVRFNGNVMSMPLPTSRQLLRDTLNGLHLDVLHVQTPYSPFMAGRLMRLVPDETAVVGTFHILPYSRLVTAANRVLGIVNKSSSKAFDTVMAVSEPAKMFAKSTYGYDSVVVPNPIRVSDFELPRSRTAGLRIIFLGRLVERKGAMWLLKAVAYMREHHLYDGDFEVIIGGKGELLILLKRFVDEHGLGDIVSFPGFIPENEKAALLASGDITVFPSISGESFGISLLEALAASRGVVLAGDNPGYRSVMHGFPEQLFDPQDTEAFAGLLAKWLGDAKARGVIRTHQREYVKQFDISVVGSSIEKIYREALQSRRVS